MIVLIAGGSGGHVFPAISIAQRLKNRNVPVVLLTDSRGMCFINERLHGDLFQKIYVLPKGLNLFSKYRLFKTLDVVWTSLRALVYSRQLFKILKPTVLCGFGGRMSGIPLLWAHFFAKSSSGLKPRTAIHQSDRIMGMANRILSRFVSVVFTSYPDTRRVPKRVSAIVVGTPIREEFFLPFKREAPFPLIIAVLGGSRGADFWTDLLPKALSRLSWEERRRLFLVHHALESKVSILKEAYEDLKIRAHVTPFLPQIWDVLTKSHLALTRAGASSIAELIQSRCPAFFVPYPYATDQHQLLNAQFLENHQAGWVFLQNDLQPQDLARFLSKCIRDTKILEKASLSMKALATEDSAEKMVHFLLSNPREIHAQYPS
jgi:UDP-N-acetylglucosamine--N-acetylmuramyl-(pentapeptide) pyrophosphoryl-undecaprenol N-acetylglucosamine transferase